MRKGQAAMEFLMTYGWAILVVLAAIVALAAFGLLSPSNLLPDTCQFVSGITCVDATADDTEVIVVVRNGLGFDMNGATITVDDCGTSSSSTLVDGEQATYTITCSPALTSGSRLNSDMSISYTNANSGLDHVGQGSLIATVQ